MVIATPPFIADEASLAPITILKKSIPVKWKIFPFSGKTKKQERRI
jgi:hypothetical protein